MYKKYVHPRYNWEDRLFKSINDEMLQDTHGKIVSVSSVLADVKEDKDKIEDGTFTPVSSYVEGFVDATKEEFVSKVYDHIASKKSSIASDQVELERLYGLLV